MDVCGFSAYDESSLWHHAVQTYLQLCVRYPELSEGKEATVVLLPDLPPPAHPTALEAALIDRALHTHWESLRVFLLAAHGGLLRSAVRSFGGVKMSTFDLLCVCDDTRAVLDALGKSRKSRSGKLTAEPSFRSPLSLPLTFLRRGVPALRRPDPTVRPLDLPDPERLAPTSAVGSDGRPRRLVRRDDALSRVVCVVPALWAGSGASIVTSSTMG